MAEAGPVRSAAGWADEARRAAPIGYRGPWPKLSIWHGAADRVVDPQNATLLATQWATLHGMGPTATQTEQLGGITHDQWLIHGEVAVEQWTLGAQGHSWPPGAVEPIARFWGMAD